MTATKIDSDIGICAGLALASDTKVGIMPPSAKPIFQDNPVPLARISVGNRSLRKIRIGA